MYLKSPSVITKIPSSGYYSLTSLILASILALQRCLTLWIFLVEALEPSIRQLWARASMIIWSCYFTRHLMAPKPANQPADNNIQCFTPQKDCNSSINW